MDDLFPVKRETEAIKCPACGGYARRVPNTLKEREEYGCGRNYDCCSRAFLCDTCAKRTIGYAEAPEMV